MTKVDQVCIAIDHTGGHYSEPIGYFLKSQGYEVYYLGPVSVKAIKERLLGEENKTDKIDSATLAYLLYLRDSYPLLLKVSSDKEIICCLKRQFQLRVRQFGRSFEGIIKPVP